MHVNDTFRGKNQYNRIKWNQVISFLLCNILLGKAMCVFCELIWSNIVTVQH